MSKVNINYKPALTATAAKNYKEFFANAQLGLDQTDPELVEIFSNFAFDDVAAFRTIDLKTLSLALMASAIGAGGIGQFKFFVVAALNVGCKPLEIKEVVYQSTSYAGMSRSFDYLHAMNEEFVERNIPLINGKQSTTNRESRLEKGLAVQKSIFGSVIDQLYEQSSKDQLHIQKFLSGHCFGDFFTRDGLDLKTREIVILSMLVSMGGLDPQVKSHIRANITVGNDRSVLLSLMTQLLPWIGYPRTLNAISALNEISPPEQSTNNKN